LDWIEKCAAVKIELPSRGFRSRTSLAGRVLRATASVTVVDPDGNSVAIIEVRETHMADPAILSHTEI
jgi:hypothetical protein